MRVGNLFDVKGQIQKKNSQIIHLILFTVYFFLSTNIIWYLFDLYLYDVFHSRFVIHTYVRFENIRMLLENERRFMNAAEPCAGAGVIRKAGFRGETNRGIFFRES